VSAKKPTTYSGAVLRMHRDERMKAAVDPAEQARRSLENHERVIENARRSFVAMGQALLAIRTERLYAGEFSTFADYCDARWDISEAYANRVINAALVAIEATPIGVEINSEAVARELVGLTNEPDMLRQVWDEATRRAAGGRVTAALVKEVRKSLEPPPAEALDGEVVDPLSEFPAAEQAVNDFIDNQTSGLVDDPRVDESGDDHPAPPLGDAADVAGARDLGDETGEQEEPPVASLPVDEPEPSGAGVSRSAPASPPAETAAEQAAREDREMREARSLEFATGLVNVRMRLEPDPVRWYQNVYLHDVYHARNLPRVRDSFTPTGIRQAARFLNELADHLEAIGEEL
jgi:hypothetical protein